MYNGNEQQEQIQKKINREEIGKKYQANAFNNFSQHNNKSSIRNPHSFTNKIINNISFLNWWFEYHKSVLVFFLYDGYFHFNVLSKYTDLVSSSQAKGERSTSLLRSGSFILGLWRGPCMNEYMFLTSRSLQRECGTFLLSMTSIYNNS